MLCVFYPYNIGKGRKKKNKAQRAYTLYKIKSCSNKLKIIKRIKKMLYFLFSLQKGLAFLCEYGIMIMSTGTGKQKALDLVP